MLKVNDLHVSYGAIHAVKGISFEINEGEIVALIGANGAGKTTTLRSISQLEQPNQGSIEFMGQNIRKMHPDKVVQLGIAHVPEGRRVFSNMTVADNLDMGAVLRKDIDGIRRDRKKVFGLFPRLEERKNQLAGTLSGGEQQMLAVGRAMMTSGKLLLLDEPSMGLAPMVVDSIFKTIQTISKEGMTILLVEQNAFMALKISNRAYVLENGVVVLNGPGNTLLGDERVKNAFLGV